MSDVYCFCYTDCSMSYQKCGVLGKKLQSIRRGVPNTLTRRCLWFWKRATVHIFRVLQTKNFHLPCWAYWIVNKLLWITKLPARKLNTVGQMVLTQIQFLLLQICFPKAFNPYTRYYCPKNVFIKNQRKPIIYLILRLMFWTTLNKLEKKQIVNYNELF